MRRTALGSVCFLAILVCVVCKDAGQKPVIGNRAFPRSHSLRVRRADDQESPLSPVDDISRSGNPVYESWEDYGLPGYDSTYYGPVYPQAHSNAYADASAKAESYGYPGYGLDEPGYSYGQNYGQSVGESDAYAYSESKTHAVAQGKGLGLDQSDAYAASNAQSVAQSNAYGLDQSDAYAASNAQSVVQSNVYGLDQSEAYAASNAQSVAQSNAYGLDQSDAYAASNAQSVVQSNAYGLDQSEAYAASNAQSVAQSNAYGLDQSDAYAASNAQSVAQSNAYGLDQSDAYAASNAQSVVQSNAYGLDQSKAYAASNAQSVAQSNAYGLDQSDAYATSNAQSVSQSNAYGLDQSDVYAASNAQSVAQSNAYGLGQSDAYAASNAQSVAQSNAYGLDQSDAYAASNAQSVAQSNAYGLDQSDAYATSNAQSVAQSNAYGLSQSDGYAASSAQSVAQSNAYGLGHSDTYAASNAQSVAQSNLRGLGQSDAYAASNTQSVAQSNAQGLSQGDAYAESNAQAVAQGNALAKSNAYAVAESNAQGYYNEPTLEIPMYYQYGQDQIKPDGLRALGSVVEEPLYAHFGQQDTSAHSSAHAFAGAYSRLIPREEHIRPHSMSGGKDAIQCTKEGQIFQLWIPVIGCTVCICVKEGYYIEPYCVKCDCSAPQHGVAPTIEAPVVIQPVVPAPLPQPESQVSCDPLPTDTPFENPTNPCQICVCQRSINSLGQPDIQITCEENPECLVPPQPSPQPQPQPQPQPLPQPIPIPEPEIVPVLPEPAEGICQEYPLDVPFQDPADACSICICTIEHSQYKVTCQPDPACDVKPFIVPELIHPVEPLPVPIPEPILIPQKPEPIPEPKPEPIPEPIPEPYPEIVPYPEPIYPEPEPEIIPHYPEIIRDNIPLVYPEPAPQVIHSVGPNPVPQSEPYYPKPFPVPQPEPYPVPQPEPEPYLVPQPEPEPYPVPQPEPYPVPQPELYPEPQPDPYPIPQPEQIPEIEVPEVLPVPVPKLRPDAPENLPEPVPWPPAIPSPLPGPPPHESCHPYPPNTPFQHPWDVCQICVCSEIISDNVINVEVNCYTSKLCCIEPPFSGPVVQPLGISGPQTSISAPAHIKFIDKICEQRSLEVEFVNPNDDCKTCKCELYGNLVVPVCKRAYKPECAVTPAPVSPGGDVVYIEPRCRYRVPSQYFRVEGSICVCEPIYRYVIAKCVKLPLNSGSSSGENKVIPPSHSSAQSNAVSSWQRPTNPPYSSNLPVSSYQLPSQGYDNGFYPYYWLQNYPGMVTDIKLQPQITPSNDLYHQLNYGHPSEVFYPSYLGQNNNEQVHAVAQAIAENSEGPDGHVEPNDHHAAGSNAFVNVGRPHLAYGNLYGWNPYGRLQSQDLNDVNNLHMNAVSNAEANVQTDSTLNAYYNLLKNIYGSNYLGQNNGQRSLPYGYYNYGNNKGLGMQNPYYLGYNNAHATAESVGEIGQWDAQAVAEASAQANGAQSNAQANAHSNINIPSHGGFFVEEDALANALTNAHATQNHGLVYPHRHPQNDVFLPGYAQTNSEANALANAQATQNHGLAYPHRHPQNDVFLPGYAQTNAEVLANAQATHDYGLAYPYSHPQNNVYSQASAEFHSHSDALSNALANAQANVAAVEQLTNSLANAHASSSAKSQPFSQDNAQANSLSNAQANAYGDSQAFAQANALSNAKNYQQNIIRNQRPSNLGLRPRLFRNRLRYFDKSGANSDDNESAEDESIENGREEPTRFDLPDILTPVSITVKSGDEIEDKTVTTRPQRHDASEVFDHHLLNNRYEKRENTAALVTLPASTPLQYPEASSLPTTGLPVSTPPPLLSATGSANTDESTLTTSFPTFGTTRSINLKDSNPDERR